MNVSELDRAEHRRRIAVATAELMAQQNPSRATRHAVAVARREHTVALARRRVARAVEPLTAQERAELADLLRSA